MYLDTIKKYSLSLALFVLLGLVVSAVWIQLVKLMLGSDFDKWYPYYNQLTSSQYAVYAGIFSLLLLLIGISYNLFMKFVLKC